MKVTTYSIIFIILIEQCASNEYCDEVIRCRSLNYCSEDHKCLHESLFPFNTHVILGLFGIIICSALSNAGGIGGGGLLIPLLIMGLGFYTHEAIPISKSMIFTGALTSFFLGFRQTHPFRKAITIDYNVPYLLIPMQLLGTMFGVTLNKIAPPIVILIILTLLLIYNTKKTLKRFIFL